MLEYTGARYLTREIKRLTNALKYKLEIREMIFYEQIILIKLLQ